MPCGCRSSCARPPTCAANTSACASDHGFRLLDYSVDSDAVSPRACFQFSEDLPGKRTDFSPFVAVAGQDKPAMSADDKQLCVEGLKHGERYAVTLRAGLPSAVQETLAKSADFTIFVRDRKPFVRFSGKAYVLPRTGQRGIPVVSVNTGAVAIEIYRIGDRNLLDTVLGYDFQRNLDRYDVERLASERGVKVWSGELAVEPKLNTEVTTAFPVDQAIGDARARRLCHDARRRRSAPTTTTTSWRHPMVHRLRSRPDRLYRATTASTSSCIRWRAPSRAAQVEVRLIARNNEVLATKRTDDAGYRAVRRRADARRGRAVARPRSSPAEPRATTRSSA